jgi:hypothetical protein
MSIHDIHRELAKRERFVASLERKRASLLQKIEDIDAQIAANGGSSKRGRGGPGRTRSRNEMNLVEALSATLQGKTMSVTDAAEAVQRAGYQTTSPNFRTMVNAALLNKKKFKRVQRGQYTSV